MKRTIHTLALCAIIIISLVACSGFSFKANDSTDGQNSNDKIKTSAIAGESTSVNTICYDLLSDNCKVIYDELLLAFQNFESEVIVSGSEEDIELAYRNILSDHPEIFYISGYVYKDKSNIVDRNNFIIYPSYTEDKDSYEELLSKADDVANSWIEKIPDTYNEYDISKYLFEKVIENTSYVTDTTHNQDMLSVFLFNQSVCGGYSQGYSYLMQKCGIPCATIYGVVDEENHSWNVSIIDNNYYMSDLTNGDSKFILDDEKISYVNYSYFNVLPDCVTDYVPSCTTISCNATDLCYFIKDNSYYEVFDDAVIEKKIAASLEDGDKYLTLCFATEDGLLAAEEILFDRGYIAKYYSSTSIKYIDSSRFHTITIFF